MTKNLKQNPQKTRKKELVLTYLQNKPERDKRQNSGTKEKAQLAQIVVAQATNISVQQICAPTRSKPFIAQARQIAMYLTHVALGVSLTKTADAFGRDRTTASYACKVVEELRDDPHFDFQLSQLEEGLAKIALRIQNSANG